MISDFSAPEDPAPPGELGRQLRRLWESLGLSRQGFAKQLDLTPHQLGVIERGQRVFPSVFYVGWPARSVAGTVICSMPF